ncbi:uncharacterized protein [Cicer arietinum]|uniref:uncharacterized protein n=1 Tax=Cicer arietinum TaxID=3827 RepID=UPI003CC53766
MDEGRDAHKIIIGKQQYSNDLLSSSIASPNAMKDNVSLPLGIPSLNQVGPHGRAWSMPSESIMVHNHNHLIHGNYLGQHFHPMPYIQAPYINGSSLESASMGFQHDIVGNRNGLMLLHPPPFIQQHQHYQYHHPTLAMQRVLPNPPCSIAIPLQIAFQIYQADRFMPAIIRHHVLYSLGFVLVYDYILLGQVQNPVDHHQDMRLNIEGMSYEIGFQVIVLLNTVNTYSVRDLLLSKSPAKLDYANPWTDFEGYELLLYSKHML